MLGDGEIQEGMIWEAVQVAARYKLSNLTAIVDRNGLQQFGLPSSAETTLTDRGDRRDPWFGVDLAAVFQAFGWRVVEIDGHDYGQIRSAYKLARAGDYEGRPTVIIAHTVKGKGLSLAEGVHTWHSIVPTAEDFEKARRELEPDELRRFSTTTPPARYGSPGVKAMRDVWGDKLVELGATDPRTVVLDGDLGNSTKVDKFAKAHPERFFQMGIAEQNLVGAAAGLASVGYVPWTSSFAVFFTHRAIDPDQDARGAEPRERQDRRLVLRSAHRRGRQDPPRRAGPGHHASDARHHRVGPGRRSRADLDDGLGAGL